MKRCKYCQTEIDKKAKYCPNCQKKQGALKWKIILIIVIGIILIGSFSGEKKEDTTVESNVPNNNVSDNTSNNKNQPVEKFTYEITNQYVDNYGMAYYIEGTVKNNKEKDYSYVQIEFVCYDSEGNNLGTAIDNTNNLLGNQTWKFKAMTMFSNAENVAHCDFHDITSW